MFRKKTEVADIFGKYKITRTKTKEGKYDYRIFIDGKEAEGYYFLNPESAMLMCIIERGLHKEDENTKCEFARVIARMLNHWKDYESDEEGNLHS